MFGKMLNVVLLGLIVLGGAYVYSSLISGSIADSFNDSAALIRGER